MTPVQYTAANQAKVNAFNNLEDAQKSADYWSLEEVASIKKQIKDHYIAEQSHKCCYCAIQIPTNHNGMWDAEHVISRSLAVKYLFEPRNLAVACKDCNTAKSDKEVRTNPNRSTFPGNGSDYKIVHPHFDDYRAHIRWFGAVCSPLTVKGKVTVEMCNLLRYSLEALGVSPVPRHPVFDKLVGDLMGARDDVEAHAALGGLEAYLSTISQK